MSIEPLTLPIAGARAARYTTGALLRGIKDCYAIVCVEYGRSEWWARGRTWSSGPGTIALTQPGDVHRDVSREGEARFQLLVVDAALVEAAGGGPVATARLRRSQIDPGDPSGRPFHHLHRAIARRADPLALEGLLAGALAALAEELTGREAADPSASWRAPVRRAVELIRACFAEPLTLDVIAAHARLDKFHLSRAFRAQVGMPPHTYLTHLRVAEARSLLAAGLSAADVAGRVGFCDQSQLHRHFRRVVGTTPGHYARVARTRRPALGHGRGV